MHRVRDPTKGAYLIEEAPDSFRAKQAAVIAFIASSAFLDMVLGPIVSAKPAEDKPSTSPIEQANSPTEKKPEVLGKAPNIIQH